MPLRLVPNGSLDFTKMTLTLSTFFLSIKNAVLYERHTVKKQVCRLDRGLHDCDFTPLEIGWCGFDGSVYGRSEYAFRFRRWYCYILRAAVSSSYDCLSGIWQLNLKKKELFAVRNTTLRFPILSTRGPILSTHGPIQSTHGPNLSVYGPILCQGITWRS